jgi:hypothetical protein
MSQPSSGLKHSSPGSLQAGGQPIASHRPPGRIEVLPPFKVEARNMGLRPGLNLNDGWGLIEQIDDPAPGRR